MTSITEFFRSPWGRFLLLSLYYGAIIVGLVMLYGKGNFTAIKFVYQGF